MRNEKRTHGKPWPESVRTHSNALIRIDVWMQTLCIWIEIVQFGRLCCTSIRIYLCAQFLIFAIQNDESINMNLYWHSVEVSNSMTWIKIHFVWNACVCLCIWPFLTVTYARRAFNQSDAYISDEISCNEYPIQTWFHTQMEAHSNATYGICQYADSSVLPGAFFSQFHSGMRC